MLQASYGVIDRIWFIRIGVRSLMRREKYLLDPRATPYTVCWAYKPFISAAHFGAGCPMPPTEQSMPVQLPAVTASCQGTMPAA